jgi:hypothetical protein
MSKPDEFCEHGNFKSLCFACDYETWADYLRATGRDAQAMVTAGKGTIGGEYKFPRVWFEAPEEEPKDA